MSRYARLSTIDFVELFGGRVVNYAEAKDSNQAVLVVFKTEHGVEHIAYAFDEHELNRLIDNTVSHFILVDHDVAEAQCK